MDIIQIYLSLKYNQYYFQEMQLALISLAANDLSRNLIILILDYDVLNKLNKFLEGKKKQVNFDNCSNKLSTSVHEHILRLVIDILHITIMKWRRKLWQNEARMYKSELGSGRKLIWSRNI